MSTGASALNPSVHWFTAWNGSAVADSPANALPDVSTYNAAIQPDAPKSKIDAKSKKNPTTAHAPAAASANPAPANHVQMRLGGFSYVFADFEANRGLSKSNPDASPAQTHGWTIFTSPIYSEYESTLPHAFETDQSKSSNPFFLTKAQYENLHLGGGSALYPGAISIFEKLSDGNSHRGFQAHFPFADGKLAAARVSDSTNLTLRGDERLYHHGVPWTSALNDLMSVSLRGERQVPGSHKFPAVMGFAQLGGSAGQTGALKAVADQIAYFRLRGPYGANTFEQGLSDYDDTDQEAYNDENSTGSITDSDRAASRARARAKRAFFAFNPTIDATGESKSQIAQDVSSSIWAGAYALKTDHAPATKTPAPNSSAAPINYRMVDVYDVFEHGSNGAKLPLAAGDDSAPLSPQVALVDASIHRLLEYNPSGARDYKGTSVVVIDPTSAKPVWVLNDSYTITAKHEDRGLGLPQPTLFGTCAAAAAMAVLCRRRRRAEEAVAI